MQAELSTVEFDYDIILFQNELIYPQSGWVEMDPETLWTNVVSVAKEAITSKYKLPFLLISG